MERTAEEFVHQLPDGRWVVADYSTHGVLPCVVQIRLLSGAKINTMVDIPINQVGDDTRVTKYARKSSAKRAAQAMLETELYHG